MDFPTFNNVFGVMLKQCLAVKFVGKKNYAFENLNKKEHLEDDCGFCFKAHCLK